MAAEKDGDKPFKLYRNKPGQKRDECPTQRNSDSVRLEWEKLPKEYRDKVLFLKDTAKQVWEDRKQCRQKPEYVKNPRKHGKKKEHQMPYNAGEIEMLRQKLNEAGAVNQVSIYDKYRRKEPAAAPAVPAEPEETKAANPDKEHSRRDKKKNKEEDVEKKACKDKNRSKEAVTKRR